VAFPTFDSVFNITPNTTATWSHTVTSSQSNRIILVAVNCVTTTGATTTAVSYNSLALTKIIAKVYNGTSSNEITLWYRVAPSTGSNTVSVTITGTGSLTGDSVSYYNVSQTSPIATSASFSGTTLNPSNSLSSTDTTMLVVDALANRGNASFGAAGSGQTSRYAGAPSSGLAGSEKTGTSSSTTMSRTMAADNWGQIIAALNSFTASHRIVSDGFGGTFS